VIVGSYRNHRVSKTVPVTGGFDCLRSTTDRNLNKNAAGDCGDIKREKFVQATGAIRGGGVVSNPRTPMQRKELPDFSYRMARIIAFPAQIANILIQYRPHVMRVGRLSKALGHHRLGLFYRH
jgi:hypothetical protein